MLWCVVWCGWVLISQSYCVRLFALQVIEFLGLAACEGTGACGPDERAHMLLLGGMYLGGTKVLVRAHVQQTKNGKGSLLKMAVRSENAEVCKFVIDCIQ